MIRIYTAGPMEHDEKLSSWRKNLVRDAAIAYEFHCLTMASPSVHVPLDKIVEFVHPEDQAYRDHNGPDTEWIVSENYKAFLRCNAVIAYLKRPDQHGTLTELFWAKEHNIPVRLAVHTSLDPQWGNNHSEYWYVEEYLGLDPIWIDRDNEGVESFVQFMKRFFEETIPIPFPKKK